ncbi:MAG: M20 family metallopeptidase [Myxococcota bacterium]
MADLAALLDEARGLLPELVTLRRALHSEPELGLELPKTREKVLERLEALPLEIETHRGTSGVVATLRGARPGRSILLRADMDALPMPADTGLPFASKTPGAMHACGHDAHTAMLVGAAQMLSARRDELAGSVVFMFQPGEEGHAGAHFMLDEGLLEREPAVDGAFALHVAPEFRPGMIATRGGTLLASADVFEITVRGKGGHASMPHLCRDPIPAACSIVPALQTFLTRSLPPSDPAVITVTQLEAGTTTNVIPESAKLAGTIRAHSEAAREKAHEGVHRVADGVARAHGVEADVNLVPGYPVTVNDGDFDGFVRGVARELLGERAVLELPAPFMGAEDFSYVLQKVKGSMAVIGMRPPGKARPAPCHSNRMKIDENGMAHGAALHAAVALRFLG